MNSEKNEAPEFTILNCNYHVLVSLFSFPESWPFVKRVSQAPELLPLMNKPHPLLVYGILI